MWGKYNFWQDTILGNLFVLLIFYNPTDNFDIGWVFILADFGEAACSLMLTILATYCGNAIWWKLSYIMMVALCNLHVEDGHCIVKQMYKNVLNNIVKVTNGL